MSKSPIVRATSMPITGSDIPISPRPAYEFSNEEEGSSVQTQIQIQPDSIGIKSGPFLHAEPQEEVLIDPAREYMTSEQILRWNHLVQMGNGQTDATDINIEFSGVPLSRYAAIFSKHPWNFNTDPNRGGMFAVSGNLDATGRPLVRTDNTWIGHSHPNERDRGYKVVMVDPNNPLLDQQIVDHAWHSPHEQNRMPGTRHPFYRFSPYNWEGFANKHNNTTCELTIIIVVLFLVVLFRYLPHK